MRGDEQLEREHLAHRRIGEAVAALAGFHEVRPAAPGGDACFGDLVEDEPGAEDGREDLPHRVVPLVVAGAGDRRSPVGHGDVGSVVLPSHGLGLLEIGLVQGEPVGDVVPHGHEGGVIVAQQQAASGAQEGGDDASPCFDVRQPAQNAERGVDEVEGAFDGGAGVVDVGLDQLDVGPGSRGQAAGPAERLRRDVEADDARRSQPRQGDGVQAQVALEVDDVEACQVPEALGVLGDLLGDGVG